MSFTNPCSPLTAIVIVHVLYINETIPPPTSPPTSTPDDLTNLAGSGMFGATGLLTSGQLDQEFRPYHTVNANHMI